MKCKSGHFTLQKALFCTAKWPLLQVKMACIGMKNEIF